jgi:hypothetical protein
MPKRKAQEKPPLTSKEFQEKLDSIDSVSLIGALNSFENSLGWELMKSFMYYQAAVHGTMSNVLIQQTGKTMEACASGAKAEVLREVIDQFMQQLRDKVIGKEGVVEEPIIYDSPR